MRLPRYRLTALLIIQFFSILIPVALIASYTSMQNFQKALSQILSAKQRELDFFVNQYDINLKNVNGSIQNLLFDDTSGYVALQKTPSDSRYQMAKYSLKQRLEDYLDVFSLVDAFYVSVNRGQDVFVVEKADNTLEQHYRQEAFREDLACKEGFTTPGFLEYQDQRYLVSGYQNSYMEIGWMLSMEKLADRYWGDNDSSEEIQVLLPDGAELPKQEEEYVFSKDLTVIQAQMALAVPKTEIQSQLGIWERMGKWVAAVILVLLPLSYLAFRFGFLIPLKRLGKAMERIRSGEPAYRIEYFSRAKEISEIERAFNETLDYNHRLEQEASRMAVWKEQQQLLNLRLQINPHLLLNSLNTIYSLAQNQKLEEIQSFSMNLAKYFRYALRDTKELVTLRSEIDFINSYVKVQKIRYPDRFYVMFDVEEDLMEAKIPPLIIENFVENSTKYALKPDEEIEILVIVREESKKLRVSICDNGRGMEADILRQLQKGEVIVDSRGKHIGIWNCVERLKNFFGDRMDFSITSTPGSGTQIWFEIPKVMDPKARDKEGEQ